MFLNFFLQSSTVVSDTVSNAAANANSAPSPTDSVSYLDFILKGGIMIIPIIILLFFCIYVIVERNLSIKKAAELTGGIRSDIDKPFDSVLNGISNIIISLLDSFLLVK